MTKPQDRGWKVSPDATTKMPQTPFVPKIFSPSGGWGSVFVGIYFCHCMGGCSRIRPRVKCGAVSLTPIFFLKATVGLKIEKGISSLWCLRPFSNPTLWFRFRLSCFSASSDISNLQAKKVQICSFCDSTNKSGKSTFEKNIKVKKCIFLVRHHYLHWNHAMAAL